MAAAAAGTGKAAENKRQKREALFNTAYELFSQQGIANTSIQNIVEKAGVAKGTFYLYFKDKYDLRDRLVRHKASQVLGRAWQALQATNLKTLEDKLIFMAGNIVSQLNEDRMTLRFITKNLSWGVLKHEMSNVVVPAFDGEVDVVSLFREAFEDSEVKYKNPEVMLYMIIELVGSCAYNSILYGDPVPVDHLRPYLQDAIKAIMRSQELPSGVQESNSEAPSS